MSDLQIYASYNLRRPIGTIMIFFFCFSFQFWFMPIILLHYHGVQHAKVRILVCYLEFCVSFWNGRYLEGIEPFLHELMKKKCCVWAPLSADVCRALTLASWWVYPPCLSSKERTVMFEVLAPVKQKKVAAFWTLCKFLFHCKSLFHMMLADWSHEGKADCNSFEKKFWYQLETSAFPWRAHISELTYNSEFRN